MYSYSEFTSKFEFTLLEKSKSLQHDNSQGLWHVRSLFLSTLPYRTPIPQLAYNNNSSTWQCHFRKAEIRRLTRSRPTCPKTCQPIRHRMTINFRQNGPINSPLKRNRKQCDLNNLQKYLSDSEKTWKHFCYVRTRSLGNNQHFWAFLDGDE